MLFSLMFPSAYLLIGYGVLIIPNPSFLQGMTLSQTSILICRLGSRPFNIFHMGSMYNVSVASVFWCSVFLKFSIPACHLFLLIQQFLVNFSTEKVICHHYLIIYASLLLTSHVSIFYLIFDLISLCLPNQRN